MSGFEAILGVVSAGAGLLSLSIQLGESAMKLKRIYNAAKDAPANLQTLLLDLETMALALEQLEHHRRHDSHHEELMIRCIARCQQSTQVVQQVVDRLERSLTKHSRIRGRLYSAFKERDVKDLLDDLERAKTSLHIAYSMYMHAEQQRRDREHHAILTGLQEQLFERSATISQEMSILTEPSVRLVQLEQAVSATGAVETLVPVHDRSRADERATSSVRLIRHRKKTPYFRTSFRFPSWFSSRIWNMAMVCAQGGWTFELTTWNAVPRDSLVFRYCRTGNLAGLRRLMANKEASPLDIIEFPSRRETLLEVAFSEAQVEICRFLLSLAVLPDHITILSRALDRAVLLHFTQSLDEMYTLVFEDPEFCADISVAAPSEQRGWLTSYCSTSCLDIVLRHQGPEFLGRSASTKFDLAVQMFSLEPEGFLKLIGVQRWDNRLVHPRGNDGESVLHLVAFHLSHDLTFTIWSDEYSSYKWSYEWFRLGVDMLRNGADPHAISRRWEFRDDPARTPLIQLLLCYISPTFSPWWDGRLVTPVSLLRLIRYWATMVCEAGLNLTCYGAQESQVWESLGVQSLLRSGNSGIYINRLIFGPNPEDWSLEYGGSAVISAKLAFLIAYSGVQVKKRKILVPGMLYQQKSCFRLLRTYEM
ncbi:hypothetical protein PV08_08741 [Exophiala spinifera]|uniref:Fungal N-terminal domain-containing protein n=1 Tax=Exophiala spinifera TaxID=91928 RepID=A0A0D2B3U0_9EURO|nr:uncharacterized protein PV08_08741 [Exophiala spinifera]KIW13553.1 hypothetical protein PV08_08741 [Exophiala spinifera]